MAQRIAGPPDNTKLNSERPEQEVTTTTIENKNYLDVSTITTNSDGEVINPATEENQESLLETKVDSGDGTNIRTSNVNQEQALFDILKELKKINLHLSILTDMTIKNTEVE